MPASKKQQSLKSGKTTPLAAAQCSLEVDFVLECLHAERVYVTGEFNQWQPACMRMIGNLDAGLWEKKLVLMPGRYEYKFIVDGKWQHDPEACENVRIIHGTLNSVMEVRS
jgi:5'-AMP-activated protein kinase regulatory beta subunit